MYKHVWLGEKQQRTFSKWNICFDSSSCKLIVEEQSVQYTHEAEGENEMNECRKLQVTIVLMASQENSKTSWIQAFVFLDFMCKVASYVYEKSKRLNFFQICKI